jgi:hypothetical protein
MVEGCCERSEGERFGEHVQRRVQGSGYRDRLLSVKKKGREKKNVPFSLLYPRQATAS